MINYKRLTNKEYLNKPKCFNCEHNYSNCIICERHCVDGDCFELRSELRHLAELEDKIENVTLVEFPCKVGDKVYRKDGAWQVVGFKCNRANGWKVKLERWENRFLDYHETTEVVLSAFGKTVFLTEAEKKLRELKGEVF